MTNPSPSSIQSWRWALGWALVLLLLSCLPYLIALFAAPAGWHFAGFLANPLDGHSYLAKMQQGAAGNWLFQFTYTPETHTGAFIFVFYLALGHLARLTGLPLIVMFHLARLVSGFLLLMIAWRFIRRVSPHPAEQRLAFVLLLSASGLGWLGAMLGAFPIDLWIPEAFVPYSLYTNPHFPLGMALMLVIFEQVVWPHPARMSSPLLPSWTEIRPNLKVGLLGLILALVLPFALVTTVIVLISHITWTYASQHRLPWSRIRPTLVVAFFAGPILLYDYWVSISQPIFAGWSAQNVTLAPALSDLVWGYGLVGLLAVVGAGLVWRSRNEGEHLILLWVIVTLLLVYAPFDLQRRFITGLHLPLCLLAAIGLYRWRASHTLPPNRRRLLMTGLVTLGAVGTLFVWLLPLLSLSQAPGLSETTARLFVRAEEQVVFDWLRKNTTADTVILAGPRLGMFLPGQTGARVFYGHPFETIAAEQKVATVRAFYRGEIEPPGLVDLIIYGPDEQSIGQPKNLNRYPVVFATETITVSEVKK